MKISFKYGTVMFVDGEMLRAESCPPEQFADTLKVAKPEIIAAMDRFALKHPNAKRAGMYALYLAAVESELLTEAEFKNYKATRGYLFPTDPLVYAPTVPPYFEAVYNVGLIPGVMQLSGTGLTLMVRDEPTAAVDFGLSFT